MRNFTFLFLLTGLLGFLALESRATHLYGGQISYVAVSPGVFVATYTSFMSPSASIPGPPTVQFNLRAPGCSSGFLVNANRQTSSILNVNGPDRNLCFNSTTQLSVVSYTATVVVPVSQCAEWFLSVKECPKNTGANLQPDPNACVYLEAVININTAFLQKSSPLFEMPSSLYFPLNSPATLSNLAIQTHPETDSVVYSLKSALNEHNQPLAYAGNFTFSQPVPSSTGVTLHPTTGMLTFTPNVFLNSPNSPDIYTVVVEATEYRKMAGGVRKVSSAQRSIPVFIMNSSGNSGPQFLNVTANSQPVQPNQVVEVMAGSPLVFQFSTSDANPFDTLQLFLPDPQFPGFPANTSTTVTTGPRPTGTLTFQTQTASHKVFYFPVTVRDHACPVRGVTTQIYGVKINANITGRPEELLSNAGFSVFPNPFSEQVSFRIAPANHAETIMIYNLLGQKVDQIFFKQSGVGEQHVPWHNAGKYAAGIYVAKLIAANKTVQTLKFTKVQ